LSISQNTYYPKIIINNTDTLVIITPIQLKTTNYIFAEHNKFKLENIQLNNQIISYKNIQINNNNIFNEQSKKIDILMMEDSLNKVMLNQYKIDLIKQNKIKNTYKYIMIGGISISIGCILMMLLK
jgi:hypothetical protein